MNFEGKSIGYALTGSHCTLEEVIEQVKRLTEMGANVIPVISSSVMTTDTRFGKATEWQKQLKDLTGNDIISSIVDAEPLGPSNKLDIIVIAPCTGNTTSKLANAMTDSPVLMAAKGMLRNHKPVVIAISTNDGLGLNAANIAKLLAARNFYFVPFGQDNPTGKPNSLVADMNLIPEACYEALQGKQIQPMIIQRVQ